MVTAAVLTAILTIVAVLAVVAAHGRPPATIHRRRPRFARASGRRLTVAFPTLAARPSFSDARRPGPSFDRRFRLTISARSSLTATPTRTCIANGWTSP